MGMTQKCLHFASVCLRVRYNTCIIIWQILSKFFLSLIYMHHIYIYIYITECLFVCFYWYFARRHLQILIFHYIVESRLYQCSEWCPGKPTILGMYLINISFREPTAEIYIWCGQNALVQCRSQNWPPFSLKNQLKMFRGHDRYNLW